MTDSLQDQLDKLLDTFDQRQSEQKNAQAATTHREDEFLSVFSNFRALTAHPLFERIGNHLRSRGHDFEISNQDYEVGHDGKTKDANIRFTILLNGIDRHSFRPDEFPSFTISASRSGQKVRLHGSNMMPGKGGSSGSRGEFKLEQLTSQILEQHLLKLLAEVFAK